MRIRIREDDDALCASSSEYAAGMFARESSTCVQMKFPSIAQRGEGGVIDPARFINELLMIFEVNSSCKKKMPASSRDKYYMSAASKSSACIAKVWA